MRKGKPDETYLNRKWQDERMNQPWNNPHQPPSGKDETFLDFVKIYYTIMKMFKKVGGK